MHASNTNSPSLTPKPAERMISVSTAARIAAAAGTPVKPNTILQAARRGTIQGAVKPAGRWIFPAWAFDDWLSVHTNRADYDPNDANK